MTTKEIKRAIRSGHVVVLRDDATTHICEDFFAGLVVVSLKAGVPTRLATLSDKRKAMIIEHKTHKNYGEEIQD